MYCACALLWQQYKAWQLCTDCIQRCKVSWWPWSKGHWSYGTDIHLRHTTKMSTSYLRWVFFGILCLVFYDHNIRRDSGVQIVYRGVQFHNDLGVKVTGHMALIYSSNQQLISLSLCTNTLQERWAVHILCLVCCDNNTMYTPDLYAKVSGHVAVIYTATIQQRWVLQATNHGQSAYNVQDLWNLVMIVYTSAAFHNDLCIKVIGKVTGHMVLINSLNMSISMSLIKVSCVWPNYKAMMYTLL